MNVPGTLILKSAIAEPPAGIMVVCTLWVGVLILPSAQTVSKIWPITWNDDVRFGPPSPTKRRTFSPTFAVNAWSPVVEPTDPLKTT